METTMNNLGGNGRIHCDETQISSRLNRGLQSAAKLWSMMKRHRNGQNSLINCLDIAWSCIQGEIQRTRTTQGDIDRDEDGHMRKMANSCFGERNNGLIPSISQRLHHKQSHSIHYALRYQIICSIMGMQKWSTLALVNERTDSFHQYLSDCRINEVSQFSMHCAIKYV